MLGPCWIKQKETALSLKSQHIKNTAWEKISQSTLRKAWKKVWPSSQQTSSEVDVEELTTFSSSGTSSIDVAETHTAEIFQDLQAFQLDIQMADVEAWLEDADVSQTTDEDLTDEQIIAMVENNTPAD